MVSRKPKQKGASCAVCRSKHRKAIERAIIGGQRLRIISQKYGPSASVICRHKPHMGRAIELAAEHRGVVMGESVLGKLDRMELTFVRLSQKAEMLGEFPAAIVAMKEVRETLKFIQETQSAMHTSDAKTENQSTSEDTEMIELRNRLLAEGCTREVTAARVGAATARRLMRNDLAITDDELMKSIFARLLDTSDDLKPNGQSKEDFSCFDKLLKKP